MKGKTEAHIVINGVSLTFAQSTTLRVAITSFEMHLKQDGLGNDNHGKSRVSNYLKSVKEINELIFKNM